MINNKTPGEVFRELLKQNSPLQIVGCINAYCAVMAEKVGHKSIYLSGAGVANASFGIPDLGITSLGDVVEDSKRITGVTNTPLLVDIDTGWGGAFNISRTIKELSRAGVAAIHIEDQVGQKRCGHRPNKEMVSTEEMVDRIKACVDAREDQSFFIMARTDAFANEGMASSIDRSMKYIEAGADGIFAEAMTNIDYYKEFKEKVQVPILANMTEFGKTPLTDLDQLKSVGVDMVLYPLSAFRAMSKAALNIYQALISDGHQKNVIDKMQTRNELYDFLDYNSYEEKLDQLFKAKK
jgi:methylisocitrate lyase